MAVGEALYKLACLYCLEGLKGPLANFSPLQLGVCAKGGSELAYLILQAALEAGASNDHVALLTDIANAFNSFDRDAMLAALYDAGEQFRPLWKVARFGYGHGASDLVARLPDGSTTRLSSAEGARQGCVLGSILFCFGIHAAFKAAAAARADTTARAIADDFTAVGSFPDAIATFEKLLAQPGVKLNLRKTSILWPHVHPTPRRGPGPLRGAEPQGEIRCAKLLGAYLGLPHANGRALAAHRAHTDVTVDKSRSLLETVAHPLLAKQHSMTALRMCVQGKLGYLTRVVPPLLGRNAFDRHDKWLLATFWNKIVAHSSEMVDLDTPHPPIQRRVTYQLQLPLKMGGFGLRPAGSICDRAYYAASVAASNATWQFERAPNLYTLPFLTHRADAHSVLVKQGAPTKPTAAGPSAGPLDALLPDLARDCCAFYGPKAPGHKLQKAITDQVERKMHDAVLPTLPVADQVRLMASSASSAAAWKVAHTTAARFTFLDLELHYAVRHSLGLPPAPDIKGCGWCGVWGALDHDHAHFCHKLKRRSITWRHDRIVHLVAALFAAARLPLIVERSCRLDGLPRLRPDVELFDYITNELLFGDVTVPHPATPSALKKCKVPATLLKRCLRSAYKEKIRTYKKLCEADKARMMPLVIDCYGRMDPAFRAFLERAVSAAVEHRLCDGDPTARARYTRALLVQISVELQKGNARMSIQFLSRARFDPNARRHDGGDDDNGDDTDNSDGDHPAGDADASGDDDSDDLAEVGGAAAGGLGAPVDGAAAAAGAAPGPAAQVAPPPPAARLMPPTAPRPCRRPSSPTEAPRPSLLPLLLHPTPPGGPLPSPRTETARPPASGAMMMMASTPLQPTRPAATTRSIWPAQRPTARLPTVAPVRVALMLEARLRAPLVPTPPSLPPLPARPHLLPTPEARAPTLPLLLWPLTPQGGPLSSPRAGTTRPPATRAMTMPTTTPLLPFRPAT